MDRKDQDEPAQDSETRARAEQGRKNREEMDEAPPPGADPLHEGP